MNNPNNPFDFWQQATQNYQQAMSMWGQMLGNSQGNLNLWESWRPMIEAVQKMAQPGNWQLSDLYQHELHKKSLGTFQELDKKSLGLLQEMVTANFASAYQKFVATSAKLVEEAKQNDPLVLIAFWQSLFTEYLKDLETIPRHIKKMEPQQWMELMAKIASNPGDQEKYRQRFLESLQVKLKYGMEYYANPETTQVGLTPKELVWQQGTIKLYRYPPLTPPTPGKAPLLIVYSLINRPYILDLMPGVSLIEHFLQNGLEVYLIDWQEPTYADRTLTLDDMLEHQLHQAVEFIGHKSGSPQVSLLGHCMGGVLTLMYAALHPEKVATLLTLTTPVSSQDQGIVSLWVNHLPIPQLLELFGNMPAKLIRYTFISIKPYYEVIRWQKFYENLHDDKAMHAFFAVDKWVNDNIDVPGEVFRKFTEEVYRQDRFKQGKTEIHGRPVSLSRITCPLLNIFAEDDWIVPPASASLITELVGSQQKLTRKIPGQHLSILLDPRNRKLWDEIVTFFKQETGQAVKPETKTETATSTEGEKKNEVTK